MGRNSKIKKLVIIFFSVLFFVLIIGGILIGAYGSYMRQSSDEKKSIVFFEWIDAVKESYTENKAQENETKENFNSLHEKENEKLYEEAVRMEQKVKVAECANDNEIAFTFAGDVLLDENYAIMSNFILRGSKIEDTFSQYLIDKMRNADIFMLNNEFTFTDRGTPTKDKTFTFRSNPKNVEILNEIGTDVVSLANNHAYDFGEVSILDTMKTLEDADISYVGAGRNIEDAKKPLYIVANGMKIAIVSATQIERLANPDTKEATENTAGVLRCWDKTALLSVIAEAEANADFTILYIHWGTENHEEIDSFQEEQAPAYVKAGVDLVIGDHPHCLQKIEIISGVPVFYSLGNFWFNSKTVNTCLVEAIVEKNGLKSVRFIPAIQSDCRVKHLEGDEKAQLLNYMRTISQGVIIDDEGYIELK